MGAELEWLLLDEKLHDGKVLTESNVDAALHWLVEVDQLWLVTMGVDALLQLGEEGVDVVDHIVVAVAGMLNDSRAHTADEVVLGEELVDLGGLRDGNEAGSDCEFHWNIIF